MLAIIHLLLGSLIGLEFHSIAAIILLSLVSHFILDFLPHWDGEYNKKFFESKGRLVIKKATILLRVFDFLITFVILIVLYGKFNSKLLVLGGVVAIFPDLLKVGYKTPLKKNKLFRSYLKFHSKIQSETNIKIGLAVQLTILIILLVAIF